MGHTVVVNTRNRMLSQNLYMSLNTRHTDLNNNILLIGGSGAGKTFRFVLPALMQMNGSYVITDPKGEIMRKSAGFLKHFGYQVKAINLLNENGIKKSTRYNPLRYVRNDTDIEKLVTTFMTATEKKNAQGGEQFWDNMASILLQAFMYYAYYEGVEVDGQLHHDFKGIMKLVNMCYVKENDKTGAREHTTLDMMFKNLERKNPHHPAVINYNKVMVGAAETVRSVISVLNSRTACLQTPAILNLLSDDEMDLQSIGVKKTVVYCMISDLDQTYNFLVSMLYRQMYQVMYEQADFVYDGELPIHVTFLLDEFANVKLPEEYNSWISTQRSRNMSSIIIIQNLVQIKSMYKDLWENITGNSDTLIYLGGNEQSTHKFVSEMLDKMTIDKQTQGQTRGRQGSSSTNDDVMGRELMLPGEVRKMSRSKCLVIINGKDPVIDYKIQTKQHPLWKSLNQFSKKYKFDGRLERHAGGNRAMVSKDGIKSYIQMLEKTDLELFKKENQRMKEEYEEEYRVAQITGEELPDEPSMPVMTMSLEELAVLVDSLEEEQELPEGNITYEELEGFISESAEDCYFEYPDMDPEVNPAGAVLEQYAQMPMEMAEELPEEVMQAEENNKIMGEEVEKRRKEKEAKLLMVTKLKAKGFSMEQIQLLKPIMTELNLEQITTLFEPDMTEETLKSVIDFISD